jgi:hypothetical protein
MLDKDHYSLHMQQHSTWTQDQSLNLLLNAACLAEKQQISILLSLVWPERGSNQHSNVVV